MIGFVVVSFVVIGGTCLDNVKKGTVMTFPCSLVLLWQWQGSQCQKLTILLPWQNSNMPHYLHVHHWCLQLSQYIQPPPTPHDQTLMMVSFSHPLQSCPMAKFHMLWIPYLYSPVPIFLRSSCYPRQRSYFQAPSPNMSRSRSLYMHEMPPWSS